jgi:hypothetical protein
MQLIQFTAGIGENKEGKVLSPDFVSKALDDIRYTLSSEFGGFTELDSVGGWLHEGRVIQEKGKTWQVATDKQELIEYCAKLIAKHLDQYSVFVVANGVPSFVKQ